MLLRAVPAGAAELARHLPGYGDTDAFEVAVDNGHLSDARSAATELLTPGRGGRAMLRARDRPVRPFRLAGVTPDRDLVLPIVHKEPGMVVFGLAHQRWVAPRAAHLLAAS